MEWPYLIAWVCPPSSLIHEVINNIHNELDLLFIHCSLQNRVDIMQSETSKFSNSVNCHTVKPQFGPIIIYIPSKY